MALTNSTRNHLGLHKTEVSQAKKNRLKEVTDPVTLTVVMAGVTVAAIASINAAR